MNEKPEIEVGKLPVITKFIYTLGVLPTSYLMSMTYQEQVTWLYNYLQTQVIPLLNTESAAIQELQTLYELLRTYVNDYFDNLDVQEEINNKLENMSESGELTQLIKNYVDPIYQEYEGSINEEINNFESGVNERISTINTKVNNATSGSPLVASSTSEMTNTSRIYVNTSDGHWYWYDGDSWEDGGVYQATEITDASITRAKLDRNINSILDNVDDIIEYLPNTKNISFSNYTSLTSFENNPSTSFYGYGQYITAPNYLGKIGAHIVCTTGGNIECRIIENNLYNTQIASKTINVPANSDINKITTFDFEELDLSDYDVVGVLFLAENTSVGLKKPNDYVVNQNSIPEGITNAFLAYRSNGLQKVSGSDFNIPFYFYTLELAEELDNISHNSIPTIYKYQDTSDLWKTPPTLLYLDSILTTKQDVTTDIESDKITLKTSNINLLSSNVVTDTETHVIKGEGYNNLTLSVPTVTIKANSGTNKTAKVLQIGDSVTYGAGSQFNTDEKPNISWAYLAYLGKKFITNYEQLGHNINETITLSNNTQYIAKAEGHGGWKLSDYLYLENVTAEGTTTLNPFYDGTKTWTSSTLNNAGVKFSLSKYLTTNNIETPTHVIIQLGFNDNTGPTFITNMGYIISAIKEEYPNMIIGLSLPSDYGTWYQKYYPNLVNNTHGVHDTLHSKLQSWITSYMNLNDPNNDVYYLPTFFVTPTGDSIPTQLLDDKDVAFRGDGGYHPNHKAHVKWAELEFAWILYTLAE